MPTILTKLNRRFAILENEGDNASWKDPRSPEYDRQKAEDALFHTIGPLTDDPVWNDAEWSSPGEPVPGWQRGGRAPKWTPEEVVYAIAGDPQLLFRASENPRSPGYGNKGGAPLFRLAKKVARHAGREKDREFIADLYSNGFIPLTQMMHPGYDERRGPFISYVIRTIQSAMEHGTGGTTAGGMAGGERSQFFTDPSGNFRKRRPSDAGEGWTEHTAIGVPGVLKMKDPKQVRQAAQVVQGKYQKERHHDKNPQNPFGAFSPKYFALVNQYADALENGDEGRIEAAQSQLRQFGEEIEDAETPIRGASTGLGQAISTLDRAKGNLDEVKTALQDIPIGETGYVADMAVEKINDNTVEIRGQSMSLDSAARELATQGIGVQSMDIAAGDNEGTAAGNIEGTGHEESWVDPESITYILDLAINHNLGDLVKSSDKFNQIAISAGAKVDKDTGKAKVTGPMTANELRYTIRGLGPLGSNYPGRGRPREKTNIPRDARGWWQVGEDPEIEPIPSGGLWHSAWSRDGYQPMGPTAIAQEMTNEVHEFVKLGIKTQRWTAKVKGGDLAVSKVAVSNQFRDGKVKLVLLANIHRYQLGMDEAKAFEGSTITESLSVIDRDVIVATCEAMIRRLDRTLSEESPPGWKGSIHAMLSKHPDEFSKEACDDDYSGDKKCPYAIANAMKNKGAKPHYKDKEGKPEKKKQYAEGMRPVDALEIDHEVS